MCKSHEYDDAAYRTRYQLGKTIIENFIKIRKSKRCTRIRVLKNVKKKLKK